MVDQRSPLAQILRPGKHARPDRAIGVSLSEVPLGSVVQLAAWRGGEQTMMSTIRETTGLDLPPTPGGGASGATKSAFGFAPGKFLITDQDEGLAGIFAETVTPAMGTVTDLSHGRTVIRIGGPKAEWVLAKLFAVDFSSAGFPVSSGLSTAHHDIFAQIQRTGDSQFDVYVFRSFARAFWKALCHSSAEVGYEIA